MSVEPAAVGLGVVLCGLAGYLVPAMIRRIPEPHLAAVDPTEADLAAPAEPEKETYADVAALSALQWAAPLASAVSGGLVGLAIGLDWPLLFLLPLVPVSVALAVVDWRTRLLPTRLVAPTYAVLVPLVLVCWLVTGETEDLVRAAWGWLLAGGLFLVLWLVNPRGLGYGDVRLSGVLGIALGYVGWGPLMVGVYGGFLLGGVGGGLLSLLRIVERRAFPFGPFMLVGALLGLLAGPGLWAHLVSG